MARFKFYIGREGSWRLKESFATRTRVKEFVKGAELARWAGEGHPRYKIVDELRGTVAYSGAFAGMRLRRAAYWIWMGALGLIAALLVVNYFWGFELWSQVFG